MCKFNKWMASKGMSPWVVAKRTPRIVEKYGESVTCLSPQRYTQLNLEFDAHQWAEGFLQMYGAARVPSPASANE